MWREPPRLILVVVLALFVAACTNGSANDTTSTDEANPTPTSVVTSTTTTTRPNTTTTSAPATTAPTGAVPTVAVGSSEVLAEQVEVARDLIRLSVDDEAARSIPVPDLTNPDPLVALRELLLFEVESLQVGSVQQYADVLAVRGSPAFGSLRRSLDTFSSADLHIVFRGNYRVHALGLLSEAELAAISGQDVVDSAPPGSAFVAYETSSDPYDIVREDGSIFQEEDGWEPRWRAAILAPTDSGWKYYWDESE